MKVKDREIRVKIFELADECNESLRSIEKIKSRMSFYAVVLNEKVRTPFLWRLQDEFGCYNVKVCKNKENVEIVFEVISKKYFE